jgi:hypothetical protein
MIATERSVPVDDAAWSRSPARQGAKLAPVAGMLLLSAMACVLAVVPHRLTFTLVAVLIGVVLGYLLFRKTTQPFDLFETFFVYGVMYVVYFGVGTIFMKFYPQFLPSLSLEAYLDRALALAVLGFMVFTAGYALLGNGVKPSQIGRYRPRGVMCFLLPGIVGFAGQLASAYHVTLVFRGSSASYVVTALSQLSPFFLFSWFLVWYCIFARQLSRVQRTVLLVTFIPMCALVIYSTMGRKALAIMLLLMPAVAFWYARRKLLVKTMAAVILVGVFVIFPIYNAFRNQDVGMSVSGRLDRTMNDARRWNSEQVVDKSVLAFLTRLSIVSAPAAVIRDAGRRVDFKYGQTIFVTPLAMFVPRFVWPDKPRILGGHEFGQTFGLISRLDRTTAITTSTVGELYWNFHVPGVVLGMFLLGGIYKWIYKKYGEGGSGDVFRKATYLLLVVLVLNGEVTVAGWLSELIKTLFIVWLLFFFYLRLGLVCVVEGDADLPVGA